MSETLDPKLIFDLVRAHIPVQLRQNMVVAGSLAAAYNYRHRLKQPAINTKDCDAVVQPAGAIRECQAIAKKLLADKWRKKEPAPGEVGCIPQKSAQPESSLSAIRLVPPKQGVFFLELLGLPERDQRTEKRWVPIELDDGWYAYRASASWGLRSTNHTLPRMESFTRVPRTWRWPTSSHIR
jgi:hypothetical protein